MKNPTKTKSNKESLLVDSNHLESITIHLPKNLVNDLELLAS
jgi:hypothetical protein